MLKCKFSVWVVIFRTANSWLIKVNKIKITFLHLAASELFNAVNVVATAFIEAGHEISRNLAFTPTNVVERTADIFIVTGLVTFGVTLRMAALCFVNVVQVCRWPSAQSEAVQVVTSWTQGPDIKTKKRRKLLSSTKLTTRNVYFCAFARFRQVLSHFP